MLARRKLLVIDAGPEFDYGSGKSIHRLGWDNVVRGVRYALVSQGDRKRFPSHVVRFVKCGTAADGERGVIGMQVGAAD